jgi:hypothetical protein
MRHDATQFINYGTKLMERFIAIGLKVEAKVLENGSFKLEVENCACVEGKIEVGSVDQIEEMGDGWYNVPAKLVLQFGHDNTTKGLETCQLLMDDVGIALQTPNSALN